VILDSFVIEGDFHHRSELARMHNAICCITGRLNSVLYEGGIGVEGSKEGYTSFGSMHFEDDRNEVGLVRKNLERDFYSALEETPWLHDADVASLSSGKASEKESLSEARKTWLFSDEVESSERQGGADWRVAARARGMFVPMPLPPLPSNLEPTQKDVKWIETQLKQGLITSVEAAQKLSSLEEEIRLQQQPVGRSETEELSRAAESDSTALTEDSPHQFSPRDESQLVPETDGRLDKVTGLLEQLVLHMGQLPAASTSQGEELAAVSTNASGISAMASGISAVTSAVEEKQHTTEEELRKEVLKLKEQLAAQEAKTTTEHKSSGKMPSWLKKVKRRNRVRGKHGR